VECSVGHGKKESVLDWKGINMKTLGGFDFGGVLIFGLGIASIICTVQVFGNAIQFLNK
jgi:hypothetical protein